MTADEIDKKIENLVAWVHMYDDKIVRLKKKMEKFKHMGYPSTPPNPAILGPASIEQRKPPVSDNADRILDHHLESARQIYIDLLLVTSWREEIVQTISLLLIKKDQIPS